MLLSEILFNIKNLKAGGLQSDDIDLSDEQIIYIFEYYRAMWIEQEYNKSIHTLDGLSQVLGTGGLIQLTDTSIDGIGSGSALDGWRITEEIPSIINTKRSGLAITYFGSTDGTNPYSPITRSRVPFIEYARYTSLEGFYSPHGFRFLVKTPNDEDEGTVVAISAVLEHPHSAYKKYDANLDVDFHYEYPMHDRGMSAIVELITKKEISITNILPVDTINDSKDNQVVNANS